MYFKNAIEYHPTQRLVAARIGQVKIILNNLVNSPGLC